MIIEINTCTIVVLCVKKGFGGRMSNSIGVSW